MPAVVSPVLALVLGRQAGVAVCRECLQWLTAAQVAVGEYDPETATCAECFAGMAADRAHCFAARYEFSDPQCRTVCEDRKWCRNWPARSTAALEGAARRLRITAMVRRIWPGISTAAARRALLRKTPKELKADISKSRLSAEEKAQLFRDVGLEDDL